MLHIVKAKSPAEYADAAKMILAYRTYIDSMRFHECISGDMDAETQNLPSVYPDAKGGVFVAYWDNRPAGCVAVEEQSPGIAEIRRLYVKDDFRGKQIGKHLIARAVEEAKALGYRMVRLDTFRAVSFASSIYSELGFKEVPPFNQLPAEKVLFMEQAL